MQVFPAPDLLADDAGGRAGLELMHKGRCSGRCAYIDLVWTQPHPNGEPVLGYRLLGRHGHQVQPRVLVNDTGQTTQFRVEQLKTNSDYSFQVELHTLYSATRERLCRFKRTTKTDTAGPAGFLHQSPPRLQYLIKSKSTKFGKSR